MTSKELMLIAGQLVLQPPRVEQDLDAATRSLRLRIEFPDMFHVKRGACRLGFVRPKVTKRCSHADYLLIKELH
jgi:hypothetical protein